MRNIWILTIASLCASTLWASEPLCPLSKPVDGKDILLSDLYIIKFVTGQGSQNIAGARKESAKVFELDDWSNNVRYRATCDYKGETIGVEIRNPVKRCFIRRNEPSYITGCE
jgi:hypothetical protein